MRDTPQRNSDHGNAADEPLYTGELVFRGPDRDNDSSFARLERDEEEDPDEKNRDDADGKCDEEPDAPARLRPHILQSDDVLRRGDGGRGTTYICGKGDTKNEGF